MAARAPSQGNGRVGLRGGGHLVVAEVVRQPAALLPKEAKQEGGGQRAGEGAAPEGEHGVRRERQRQRGGGLVRVVQLA